MKIALIGPGLMSIPPVGWGGVEILIWHYYQKLKNIGHDVTIFNTRDLQSVKTEIEKSNFDFVHLHHDTYLSFFEDIKHPNFYATSHYGFLSREEKYEWHYWKTFESFVNTKHKIICLSDKIKQQYLKYNKNLDIKIQKVGLDSKLYSFKDTPEYRDRTLYLGRIEKRKCQYIYSNINGLNFDFVGNDNYINTFSKQNKYLGSWTKDQIYKKVTDYANMCLISEGEGQALVCIEGLVSGLGLVINEEVTSNLDLSKKFITVIPNKKIHDFDYVREKVKENREISLGMRKEIRQYAEENFDMELITKEYVEKLK